MVKANILKGDGFLEEAPIHPKDSDEAAHLREQQTELPG